jgi:hypothetical protein
MDAIMRFRLPITVAAIFLVIVAAWLWAWNYAQSRMVALQQQWIDEVQAGNTGAEITYDGIVKGSNPFVARVTTKNLRVSVHALSQDMDDTPIVIEPIDVTYSIYAFSPTVMHVDIPQKITGASGDNDGTATFGAISASADINLSSLYTPGAYPVTGAHLSAQGIDLSAEGNSIKLLHIDNLVEDEGYAKTTSPAQTGLKLHLVLDGVAPGGWVNSLSDNIPFDGALEHLGVDLTISGPSDWQNLAKQLEAAQNSDDTDVGTTMFQALYNWAQAGGSASMHVNIGAGHTVADAAGSVTFDNAIQPSGTGSLNITHLAELTNAVNQVFPDASDDSKKILTALGPYLSSSTSDGQVLNVQIAYGKSGVLLNGKKQMDLPPVDWDALKSSIGGDSDSSGDNATDNSGDDSKNGSMDDSGDNSKGGSNDNSSGNDSGGSSRN